MQFFRYSLYLLLFCSSKIMPSDSEQFVTISSPNSNTVDNWHKIENSTPTLARTDLRIESHDEWEEIDISDSDSILSDCTDCSSSPRSACQSALSAMTIHQPPFIETSVVSDIAPMQPAATQQILTCITMTATAQSSPIIAPKLTDQKLIQAVKEKKWQEEERFATNVFKFFEAQLQAEKKWQEEKPLPAKVLKFFEALSKK